MTAVAAAVFFVCSCAEARTIGKVLEWRQDREAVILVCEGGDVAMSFLEGDVLRVEVLGDNIRSGFPSFLTLEQGPAASPLKADEKAGTIGNGAIAVKISSDPFGFQLLKGDRMLMELAPGGVEWNDDGSYTLTFGKQGKEAVLGLGEPLPDVMGVPLKMDYRKKTRTIWNNHLPPADLPIPFFYSARGYGLFIDNPWKAEFSIGDGGPIRYSAAGGPVRFYVIDAPDARALLERYTSLTGRPLIPPRWALGYMQSRFGYATQKDFRWLMENFRTRKIPCDTLIFDLDWFAGNMGDLWWQKAEYPDPEAFQKELESNGFKSIVITEPFIFSSSANYEEAREKKLFSLAPDGRQHQFQFWGRPSSLLDFTNPDTREWYGKKVKRLRLSGVDGWWTDLNEPEKDEGTAYSIGPREAGHNLIAFLMNKAIFDTYQKEFPDERPFIMTRSGFAGSQRWGAGIWSGDVTASWNHLRDQIPIALNAGLSGINSWNSDIGGFHGHPTPELYTRWIQFGAFCPVFRAHGNHDVREPWSFGDEAERVCRKYIELRMKLIPYLYTLFYESHATGAPIMRPTFMESPGADPVIATQFFFGRDILVAPVTEPGAAKKAVALPPGKWFYFWDGRELEGPKQFAVPVDLVTMPVFIRAGAIIPMGPLMQYTSEKKTDPLEIHYYPADSASKYELYEDDGESAGYLRGEFAITKIEARREANTVSLVVNDPDGTYKGMPASRSYRIVVHGAAGAGTVAAQGLAGEAKGVYDEAAKTFTIETPPAEKGFSVEIKF